MDPSPRLRAVCDLGVAVMRENSGRHEYDGKPQDLSPEGVRAGPGRLAAPRADGGRPTDPHDEARPAAAEDLRQVTFGELELHPVGLLGAAREDGGTGPPSSRANRVA
jgi:hypothetical protein